MTIELRWSLLGADKAPCRRTLGLDRDRQTAELTVSSGAGAVSRTVLTVPGGVGRLLDTVQAEELCAPVISEEYCGVSQMGDWAVTATAWGRSWSASGKLHEGGVSRALLDFSRRAGLFLSFYGGAGWEVSVPLLPRPGELTFISVSFSPGGRRYTYLCEQRDVAPGDLMTVPVGDGGEVKAARVEEVLYRLPEDAPYPLEMTKTALGFSGGVAPEENGEGAEPLEKLSHLRFLLRDFNVTHAREGRLLTVESPAGYDLELMLEHNFGLRLGPLEKHYGPSDRGYDRLVRDVMLFLTGRALSVALETEEGTVCRDIVEAQASPLPYVLELAEKLHPTPAQRRALLARGGFVSVAAWGKEAVKIDL